jgi:CubicO group peptidase (beta-lactamase class C family)
MRLHPAIAALGCALMLALPVAAQVTPVRARTAQPPDLRVDSLAVRAALARPEVRAALDRAAAAGVTLDRRALERHVILPLDPGVSSSEGARAERRPSAAAVRPLDSARVAAVLATPDLLATRVRPTGLRRAAPSTPRLDVEAFGAAVHEALKDSVASYLLVLRQDGQTVLHLQWNWARLPADGGAGWTAQRRTHVASVSKLITGIALTHVLDRRGISVDSAIVGFLPAYWTVGPNVERITFRHLVNHTSGIRVAGDGSDYWTMRGAIERGVQSAAVGVSCDGCYENTNFGLLRILIPVLNGFDREFIGDEPQTMGASPSWIDQMWDAFSVQAYRQYVETNVFQPAGVSGPSFSVRSGDAIAYRFPAEAPGWNPGDLTSMAGGAGWNMSADEVLRVMAAFRRGGAIVAPAVAQQALDGRYGLDQRFQTPVGVVYTKNGRWRRTSGNVVRMQQSVAYFLPENMELVVFANSQIGHGNVSFRGLITGIYENNLR